MSKYILTSFFALAGIILLQSFIPLKKMKKDGTEPGYTGSPGDSLKNCTACHGGFAYDVDGWITSNIPSSGYVPGQVYTITATNTEEDGTRFGFLISPQNISGALLGELIVTDSVQTKLVGAGKYITYTANGVDGIGFKTWSFNWKAPASGTGDVTFYGGFNSNFNGHKSGDMTFLSKLTVSELTNGTQPSLWGTGSSFSVYPNPSANSIRVTLHLKTTSLVFMDVTDMNGKQVAIWLDEKLNGTHTQQFSTDAFASGNYFVRLMVNGKTTTQKITISH